ncbi:E3 ubiquitin-protein ligase CHFR-like [Harmonia axyridis]|uniref:E3 ubiquitin-protein ligase CHFR-like n=1 Tax=Harmonia axyridis TaxID=115357 RepID=UPI001E27772A|nr:E3 ubiquitin-protein ligase CHFR-like [Harmonia axyridis]
MATSEYTCLLNLANNEVVRISKIKFSVGRSPKSDYVLQGSSISRIHFYIEKRNASWILQDNSTHGTLLNKNLVKNESYLHNGDLIEFVGGTICLKYSEAQMIDNDSISEPMTSPRRNSMPTVSNDQSYERKEADIEQTFSESDVEIGHSSSLGSSSSTIEKRAQKRNNVEVDEESDVKKSRHMEEASGKTKLKCKLEASELECSICQELYIEATTLNCGHTFCSSCIMRWKRQKKQCPICRRHIEFENPTMALDNMVKKLVSMMDQNDREQRNKLVAERTEKIFLPEVSNEEPMGWRDFQRGLPRGINYYYDLLSHMEELGDNNSDIEDERYVIWRPYFGARGLFI